MNKGLINDNDGKIIFDVKKMKDEVRITLGTKEYQIDRWFNKDEFDLIFTAMKSIKKEFEN